MHPSCQYRCERRSRTKHELATEVKAAILIEEQNPVGSRTSNPKLVWRWSLRVPAPPRTSPLALGLVVVVADPDLSVAWWSAKALTRFVHTSEFASTAGLPCVRATVTRFARYLRWQSLDHSSARGLATGQILTPCGRLDLSRATFQTSHKAT